MSDQDLICFCMSVTEGEIVTAVRAGCDSIAKLKHEVGCCTGCGTCEQRVKRVLSKTLSEMNGSSPKSPADKEPDAA